MTAKLLNLYIILLLAAPSSAQALPLLNRSSPGEPFEVKHYLDQRRLNLIVFYSAHCSASQELNSKLEQLAGQNKSLFIGLVNIDRKGAQEIDWKSPLARQYNLRVLPFVFILDKNKTTVAQGHEARKMVLELLDGAGL